MKLLAMLVHAVRGDEPTASGTESADTPAEKTGEKKNGRARCRNCGRYYGVDETLCPHCGSGNKLRSGPPAGQTRV